MIIKLTIDKHGDNTSWALDRGHSAGRGGGVGVGPRPLVDGVWLAAGGGSARAGEGVGLADDVLDVLLDQVDGHHVLGAARDDHVRVLLGRDAELLEGGLDEGGVLVQHVLQVAPALRDVPQHAPRQPRVRVRVHEQLEVELVSK